MQIFNQPSTQQKPSFAAFMMPATTENLLKANKAHVITELGKTNTGEPVLCSSAFSGLNNEDAFVKEAFSFLDGIKTVTREEAKTYVNNFRNALRNEAKPDINLQEVGNRLNNLYA